MEMGNAFPGVASVVDHYTIPAFQHVKRLGNLARSEHHTSEQICVFRRGEGDSWDTFFRDDKHMNWGLRVHVVKRQKVIFFINDVCRDFMGGDAFKKGHAT